MAPRPHPHDAAKRARRVAVVLAFVAGGAAACQGSSGPPPPPLTFLPAAASGSPIVVVVQSNDTRHVVAARFSLDLRCGIDQIQVSEIQRFEYVVPGYGRTNTDLRVFVARGCGHQERYACIGNQCFRESIDGP